MTEEPQQGVKKRKNCYRANVRIKAGPYLMLKRSCLMIKDTDFY
jgi:hypothetical protein